MPAHWEKKIVHTNCEYTNQIGFASASGLTEGAGNNGYRNINNIKFKVAHIFVVAVVSPFLASEPTGFASASGLTEGAGNGAGGSAWLSSL